MAGIYIYSDKETLAAELISFAKQAGKIANVLAFDQISAEAIAQYGADQVCLFQGDSPIVENYAKAIAGFLQNEQAELFVVGATARGRDLAARVAGYLDCGMVSDVSSIRYEDGKLTTERMLYGGAVTQFETVEGLAVATVSSGKYEAVKAGTSNIVPVSVQPDMRVALIESACIVREGVDLSVAEKVVCIGLGMEKKEDMKIAQDLADVLGAEIGCTRAVCEQHHWLPNYIGISGVTVKPSLYISMGVSGQVQHVVGMRDSKIIVAINNNDKAPIFQAADYGIVGNLYEIVPLLTEELKKI